MGLRCRNYENVTRSDLIIERTCLIVENRSGNIMKPSQCDGYKLQTENRSRYHYVPSAHSALACHLWLCYIVIPLHEPISVGMHQSPTLCLCKSGLCTCTSTPRTCAATSHTAHCCCWEGKYPRGHTVAYDTLWCMTHGGRRAAACNNWTPFIGSGSNVQQLPYVNFLPTPTATK